MMENIHTNVYQILIETLVPDAEQKCHLLQSTFEIDSIKAKAEWAKRWIAKGDFVQRLIAFSIVEGIFFSASFCSIFWIKKRGILKGVAQSNNFISRDEGMHRDVAILVYREHIVNKLPTDVVKQMIQDAVQVESLFVNDCLPYKLEGMNADLMTQYVQFVADHLCNALIGERIYEVTNPFPWMNLISVESKANFFERKVSEYQKGTNRNASDKKIVFDEEF
jgi:ribonucleoside-diphosphate reductase beta chain